jgi:hypothetical protein
MRKGKTFRERVHDARRHVAMLSPDEARQLIDLGGVLVIDVAKNGNSASGGRFRVPATSRGANLKSGRTSRRNVAIRRSRIGSRKSY